MALPAWVAGEMLRFFPNGFHSVLPEVDPKRHSSQIKRSAFPWIRVPTSQKALRLKVCPGRRIGKAGVIEHPDGRTYSFVGSVNDSASGFRHAYEILRGDDEPGAADWVRDEFEHFWAQGVDLPDAVVKHVAAMASRIEYRSIEAARDAAGNIPADDARSRITRQLIS